MAATRRQKAGFAAALTAACAVAAPLTITREGVKTDGKGNAVAYIDRAGKGQPVTLCFGQTGFVHLPNGHLIEVRLGAKVPMADCTYFLEEREKEDALPIYRITPAIAEYPHTWGAMITFAHNFNVETYRRSSMARLFAAGHWREGCDALLAYDQGTVRGRRMVLSWLVKARKRERGPVFSTTRHEAPGSRIRRAGPRLRAPACRTDARRSPALLPDDAPEPGAAPGRALARAQPWKEPLPMTAAASTPTGETPS
jgi:GH24 family phage-related lysozyme (muramidase)